MREKLEKLMNELEGLDITISKVGNEEAEIRRKEIYIDEITYSNGITYLVFEDDLDEEDPRYRLNENTITDIIKNNVWTIRTNMGIDYLFCVN